MICMPSGFGYTYQANHSTYMLQLLHVRRLAVIIPRVNSKLYVIVVEMFYKSQNLHFQIIRIFTVYSRFAYSKTRMHVRIYYLPYIFASLNLVGNFDWLLILQLFKLQTD